MEGVIPAGDSCVLAADGELLCETDHTGAAPVALGKLEGCDCDCDCDCDWYCESCASSAATLARSSLFSCSSFAARSVSAESLPSVSRRLYNSLTSLSCSSRWRSICDCILRSRASTPAAELSGLELKVVESRSTTPRRLRDRIDNRAFCLLLRLSPVSSADMES